MKNPNTKFIGQKIDYYEELPSTHKLAKSLKNEEIIDGMVIYANNQTAGIGTHQRKWIVEKRKKSYI